MAGDRNVVIRLRGEIGDFQAKMIAAGKSVSAVGDKMTGAEKESVKFRQGLASVGDTAGKIGLVAAAGLGAAVATAANFDKAMSGVRAATHESAESMDALRQAAIKAGADTAFSASEAAEGIENLAKAGVKTQDILGGGLQGALDLAAAGSIEVGEAAETAATAMTQFGLTGEQVPHIADLLAAAAGKAQGEVSDMAYALKQSGLVANQVGLSIEETTGGLAAFASAGLLGSDAGTSFKQTLAALTPNTEKAAGAMESLGIKAFDAQGNFVGLAEFAGSLRQGLSDLTDEQRQATLETIFGSDAVRAASVLYDQGAEGIQKWIDKVNDQGYAAETASIKLDNLAGDFEAFKGSLETALIGAGDGSQGMLRGLVQGATEAVNAFNNLSPAAQNVATGFLAITAVTGGGLWFGSKVVQGVSDTRDALSNLGVDASKATTAMKGLAGAAAGLAVGFAAAAAIKAIQNATDEALPGIETLTNNLLNLNSVGLASEFDSIGESLRRIDEDSKTFGERWGDAAFGQMGKVAGLIIPGVDGVAGSVREATAEIEALDGAFANIARQGGSAKAMQAFRDFAAATNLTVSEQRDLLDQMPQLAEAFASTANQADLATDASNDNTDALSDNSDGFVANTDAIRDNIKAMKDRVKAALGNLDTEAAYQEALDAGTEREEKRTEIQKRINEAINSGVKERADLQKQLAETGGDTARQVADLQRQLAKTKDPEARADLQRRIADAQRNGGERAADLRERIAESYRDQQEAVADLRSELEEYDKTLDLGTQAGRDNMEVLKGIAESFNGLSDAQKNAKGKYEEARKALVDQALQYGATRKEANKYADDLLEIPERVMTKIELDKQRAQKELEDFKREFYGLDKETVEATIKLRLKHMGVRLDLPGEGQPPNRSGFATGGYTGNIPVNDIAGVVHGREFVFDAQMTAMYRPLFEAMHRSRRVPGYREGGYVAAQTSTTNYYSGGEGIDYDRLARALSRVRPMYGDVHVSGDGSFRRELMNDARSNSLDGVR